MAILQLADVYEALSKVFKTYIGRKIELVFNLFDSIFFDSSFRIQGCKCEQLMRYLNCQHQFLRCRSGVMYLPVTRLHYARIYDLLHGDDHHGQKYHLFIIIIYHFSYFYTTRSLYVCLRSDLLLKDVIIVDDTQTAFGKYKTLSLHRYQGDAAKSANWKGATACIPACILHARSSRNGNLWRSWKRRNSAEERIRKQRSNDHLFSIKIQSLHKFSRQKMVAKLKHKADNL